MFSSFCSSFSNLIIDRPNSSDGRVGRASASGAVDLDLIPSRVKSVTLQLVFILKSLVLLDAQH